MTKDEKDGIDRRGALECMIWAGTGVLWTMAAGVPRSSLLGISEANAQVASGFTFLQISDSHIGFKQPANPNPLGTLEEAIVKAGASPQKPAFMIQPGTLLTCRSQRSSTTLIRSLARRNSTPSMSPANMTSSMRGSARPIWSVMAKGPRPKAPDGIRSIKAAYISSGWSMWLTSRPEVWARWAPNSLSGSLTI
jgi:hypothetical protein